MDDHPLFHITAGSITVAGVLGLIPPITALIGGIYYLILIIEKVTDKKFSKLLHKGNKNV